MTTATTGLVEIIENGRLLEVAGDKTFKLASDSQVLRMLDSQLPGFGNPERVIKRLVADSSLETKAVTDHRRLPVHLKRM